MYLFWFILAVIQHRVMVWSSSGLTLGFRPANERRHYFVTPSLIGWGQTQNHPLRFIIQTTKLYDDVMAWKLFPHYVPWMKNPGLTSGFSSKWWGVSMFSLLLPWTISSKDSRGAVRFWRLKAHVTWMWRDVKSQSWTWSSLYIIKDDRISIVNIVTYTSP